MLNVLKHITINPLKDLSYIHFTVEDIKTKYDRFLRNGNNKNLYKEEISAYDKLDRKSTRLNSSH